jgi:hypothetical protein
MGGQHLLNHRAHLRQREVRLPTPPAFLLQEAVRECRQDDVAVPAREAAPFEVIEPDFVFEFLVLLLDRPSLISKPNGRHPVDIARGDS